MSKRPEQHNSLKKINAESVRQRHLGVLDSLERIIKSQEKIRSQRKYRSSERAPLEEQIKVKKLAPSRLRSEVEDYVANLTHRIPDSKTPYHKLAQFRKKKTITEENADSRAQKHYSFGSKSKFHDFETAAGNQEKPTNGRKALFLNETYMGRNFKKPESGHPLTSKASSRKPNQRSDRSIKRKLDLERYTSESLEKINLSHRANEEPAGVDIKKKSERTIQKKGRSPAYVPIDEPKDGLQQDHSLESQDEEYGFKATTNEFEDKGRRIKTEMGESRDKLDIVFERRKPDKDKKPTNPFDLSREEIETFGDRFPQSFQKLKLLGRGGFSLVWLGQHKKSKKQFAIKQIRTENNHQTHIKQIWFGTYFFEMGGLPKKEFAKHPGIKNLVKIYSYDINKTDTWIFYEKCGESLGNALYDLKGDSYVGERLYRVTGLQSVYKPLYHRIRLCQHELRRVIIEVAKALQLLTQNRIVHSDLKTQNILIRLTHPEQSDETINAQKDISLIEEVKLIDYGSSFTFNNLKQFSMATPEYMAPEILNYILYENQLEYAPKLLEFLKNYHNPWVIDMWSLGCVLLEIVSGIPLWMSLKTLVRRKGCDLIKFGLFAVKGRLFDKIIKKQIEVAYNLDHYLNEENYSGIVLQPDLKQALRRMLSIDPSQRISPSDLIKLLSTKEPDSN